MCCPVLELNPRSRKRFQGKGFQQKADTIVRFNYFGNIRPIGIDMKGHSFLVNGDRAAARDIVYGTLTGQGYSLIRIDDWSAEAEKGSSGKSIVLGAFAGKKGRHVKLRVVCQSKSEGFTISLIQGTSGFSGGLIGVSQANKIYASIFDDIRTVLQTSGILVSSNPLETDAIEKIA